MAKQQGRKPPKRAPAKEPVDDGMAELAEVLAEHALDNNAKGWFSLPWRDGWNACELALAEAETRAPGLGHRLPEEVYELIAHRQISNENYHRAGEIAVDYAGLGADILRAGLRCYQILVAHSDGGGMIYNEILRPAFYALGWRIDVGTSDRVLRYRMHDAIGVYPTLINDHNDRLRRAFTTAWSRGLYHAAYAIAPAR